MTRITRCAANQLHSAAALTARDQGLASPSTGRNLHVATRLRSSAGEDAHGATSTVSSDARLELHVATDTTSTSRRSDRSAGVCHVCRLTS